MMQLGAILFGAAFTVAVCLALGQLLLRWAQAPLKRQEELPLALVAGAPILSLIVFLLGILQLFHWWLFLAIGAGVITLAVARGGLRPGGESFEPLASPYRWVYAGIFAAYGVLYLSNAMAPETSPDGSTYHLGLVSRYLRAGGLERITTNMYANISQGIEMLFVFAFAFGRHSAAALVHLAFFASITLSIVNYGRRFGLPGAGLAAALFFFLSPVVGRDGTVAYNDVATAAVLFSLFYLLRIWSESPSDRLLVPIGLLAGFCYGVKYTAAPGLVFAAAYVIWKLHRAQRLRLRPLLIFGLCAFLLVAPWMVRNAVWLDNPVSPFFNKLFPNPHVQIAVEEEYREHMRNYDGLESHWDLPLELTVRGKVLRGLLGPLFLLAPLGLIALRWKEGRWLWLLALVTGITYASNHGTRFLIPSLPYVALAMGLVFTRVPRLAPALVVAHAVLSFPSVILTYSDQEVWIIYRLHWKAALRIETEEGFLRRTFPDYEVARMVQDNVGDGEKLLAFGPVAEAYTDREILVVYQAAHNRVLGNMLMAGYNTGSQPTRRIRLDFPSGSYRKLRLVQTAAGFPEQWQVSELRVFDGSGELERTNQWRLRANPNPWSVQRAFDNSLATSWSSWEAIRDGMFLEIDFGAERQASAIVVECPPDQWNIDLRVSGSRDGQTWEPVPAEMNDTYLAEPPKGMRRMVANELKREGVRYFLTSEHDPAGPDFEERAREWNVTKVAGSWGRRLYRFN